MAEKRTIYSADIKVQIGGAAEGEAALRSLDSAIEKNIAQMQKLQKEARLTKGGFRDLRGMDESVQGLERLKRASVELAKSRGDLLKADEIYAASMRRISKETARSVEQQERQARSMERFRATMGRAGEASNGVLGATRGLVTAFKKQETGMAKVISVGRALYGVYDQLDDAIEVVQGGGNIFRGLRLAVAGTAESVNPLVGGLDRAALAYDKLRRIARFGFKFEKALQDARNMVKSLDTLRTSSDHLREAMKGVEGANFASLNQQMQKASNGASTMARTMAETGKVSESAFRNTRAQIERTINRLEEIRHVLVDAFGADSPQVKGIDQLIGRYRSLGREITAIRERAKGAGGGIDGFTRAALSKIPIVGKLFRQVTEEVNKTGSSLARAKGSVQGFRKSVDGTSGPMNQLGTALHLVNQDTQQAQFGFSGFNQSMAATIGVAAGLAGTLSQLHPAFGAIIAGAAMMAQRVVASFQVMSNAMASGSQRLKSMLTGLGTILTGFGGAALASIVSLGKFAADVEAKFIGLTVTARNAGIEMAVVNERIATLKDTGIETGTAITALMQFIKKDLPIDQIDELARASQDLAKSLGKNSSEMLERFIWFIQTGNSALLDGIGISKNASQMYEEYGETIGKTGRQLTDQEQVLARINGLMEETAGLTGIYELAATSVAGKISSLTRHFNELRLEIGKKFQPLLLTIVVRFTDLVKSLTAASKEGKGTVATVVAMIAVFGTLLGVLLLLAPSLAGVVTLFATLGISAAAIVPIIGALGAAIAGVFLLFRSIPAESEGVAGVAERLEFLIDKVGEAARKAGEFIKEFSQPLIELVQYHIPALNRAFRNFKENFEGIFDGGVFNTPLIRELIVLFRDLYAILWQIVDDALTALEAALNQDWETFWRSIGDAGIEALTALARVFVGFIPQAFTWGRDMIFSFGRGLLEAAKSAIPSVMGYVGNVLSDFLRTRSPAKRGELKNIVRWGQGAASSFASGFGAGQTAIGRGLGAFGNTFAGMSVEAHEWGKKLTDTFATGIAGQASSAIIPAMNTVGNMVSRFLEGASPPPEGPLSEIDNWGRTAFEAFLSGFEQADYSIFDKAMGLIRTRLDILYSDVQDKGGLIAGALLEARQALAQGLAGVRSGAVSLDDLSGLADSITTPVKDVFNYVAAILRAEAAKAQVERLQEAITAAREARQEVIEAQQERIRAIQKSIRDLRKHEKLIRKQIEQEAEDRLAAMGITVDPTLLAALKARLEAASREVAEAQKELERIQASRRKYGITLISWEEINAQAALDLAKQRETEAQLAVKAEEDKQKKLDELKEIIESERQAELDAIAARIEAMEENAEAEQERLEALQKANREATKAEEKQLKAARQMADELAKAAALQEAALRQRLEQEKLLAELAKAAAEAAEETVEAVEESRLSRPVRGRGGRRRGIAAPEAPEESGWLADLRALIAGGPRAILAAIRNAVFKAIEPIAKKLGIDLGKVGDLFRTATGIIGTQLGKVKKAWDKLIKDPKLQKAMGELREAWDELKGAIEDIIGRPLPKLTTILKNLAKIIFAVPFLVLIAWLEGVADILGRLGPLIATFIRVLAGFIDQLANFITMAKTFAEEVYGWFDWLYKELLGGSIIPDLINGIIGWFLKLPGELVSTIIDAVTGITDEFGALPGKMFDIAVDMMNKLIDGIVSRATAVATGIIDSVGGAIDSLASSVTSGALSSTLGNIGSSIMTGISGAISAFTGLASGLSAKVLDAVVRLSGDVTGGGTFAWLQSVGSSIMAGIQSAVTAAQGLAQTLIDSVSTAASDLAAAASNAGSILYLWLTNAGNAIANGIKTALANVLRVQISTQFISDIINAAVDFVNELADEATTLFAWVKTMGTQIVTYIIGGLTSYLSNLGQAIIDLVLDAIGLATRHFGGGDRQARGGGVPGLQSGGVVTRKMLAMIGEGGPEAIIPIRDLHGIIETAMRGLSSSYARGMMASAMGAQSLTYAPEIHFHGPVDQGQVKKEVVQAGQDWVFETRR